MAEKKSQQSDSKADSAERALKASEKRAKEVEARYKKDGASGVAMAEASKHLDPKYKKMAEAAQNMASKGEVDAKGAANMAAMFGEQAGLDNDYLKVIKAAGGDELDLDKAKGVPGLVVDKETGEIRVLGLIPLDAKDPTSKMIANAIVGGYSLLALPANEYIYPKVYKAAAKAAMQFEATRGHTHPLGMVAGASAVAATSFWPDINNFIQQEKYGRQKIDAIAQRFAPILNEYRPNAGRLVDKLYSIAPETNQMIVNERKRAAANQNAERFRNGVEILGRMPLFGISLMRGHEKTGVLRQETEAAAEMAKAQKPNEDPKALRRRLINEGADQISTEIKGISREKAIEMAEKELAGKSLEELTGGDQAKGFLGNMLGRDVINSGVVAAAPLVSMFANNLYKKRVKDRDVQPISASDMVEHLVHQLDNDPKAERFKLPDGMKELGSKTGNNQLKLEDYLGEIFRQHERDTYGSQTSIPTRFEEQLQEACGQIADTLRADKVDSKLALIRLVGEQQIVRSGGRFVVDVDTAKEKLELLEEELFLKESVDPEKALDDMGISPAALRENWHKMDGEERGFMAMDLPQQVLEYAGIPSGEVRALRNEHKETFSRELTNVMQNLHKLGAETLKAQGATSHDIKVMDSFTQKVGAGPDAADKLQQVMTRSEIAEARSVVANVVMSAQYDGTIAVGEHLHRH